MDHISSLPHSMLFVAPPHMSAGAEALIHVTVQHLGVGDTCAAWAAALNPADSSADPDLALKCAQLLSTLATGAQLLLLQGSFCGLSFCGLGFKSRQGPTAHDGHACIATCSVPDGC